MNMKQTLMTVAIFVGMLCHGAANNTILAFSTKGPDTYMDGSPVLNGECYAIVWTPDDKTFGGFSADGSLLSKTDKLVLVAPLAQDGKCPTTVLDIDAADAEGYANGKFALYLLDTRVKTKSGEIVVGGMKQTREGARGVVNSVAKTQAAAGETIVGGAVTMAEIGVYSKIGEPKITGFKVEGATVKLTVKDMYDAADYFVVPGSTPGAFRPALAVKPAGDTFTFEPAKGDKFFKVIGVRKFQ